MRFFFVCDYFSAVDTADKQKISEEHKLNQHNFSFVLLISAVEVLNRIVFSVACSNHAYISAQALLSALAVCIELEGEGYTC